MSWFRRIFEKKEWKLCGTVDSSIVRRKDQEKGKLRYYLYEDQFGNRKFDVVDDFRGDYDLTNISKTDIVYRTDAYLDTVKPWLSGRKIPGVASRDKIPHHEMKDKLKYGE